MSGTIVLIIVFGLLFYLMHRGGGHGLGCCGGHDHQGQGHGDDHQHSTTERDKKTKELAQHEHHH